MLATEPKLLIADDDRDFRESLAELFSRRGFETRLAADGREALEIIQSTQGLHLVMLDVHMPRLSGLQALAQIRAGRSDTKSSIPLPQGGLPCILMTARVDDSIVAQAAQLQTRILAKPFSLRMLTETVDEILRRSYGWCI